MNSEFLTSLWEHYQWQLSLLTLVSILSITFIARQALAAVVPTFREAAALNAEVYAQKMDIPRYAANQRLNRGWGIVFMAVIFFMIKSF